MGFANDRVTLLEKRDAWGKIRLPDLSEGWVLLDEIEERLDGQRLFTSASRRAESQGYHFGPGADQFFRQTSDEAATKIVSAGGTEDLIKAGEVAFDRLVDEMIAASRSIPGYAARHPDVIGEETLAKALSRLCPLWPIC
jgi:hypothetical protein